MRIICLAGGIACLVAAALVWTLVPVRYEAYALLRVQSRTPRVLQDATNSPEVFELYKHTQEELIRSNLVVHATLRDPAVDKLRTVQRHAGNAAQWLHGELMTDNPGNSEIIRVSLRGSEPADLVTIVDTVVAKYLSDVVNRDKAANQRQLGVLQGVWEKKQDEYQQAYQTLKQLEQVSKVNGTQTAQMQKMVATEQLAAALENRKILFRQLQENGMHITLEQAREMTNTKPARFEGNDADRLSLPLLEKQREYLQSLIDTAETEILAQTEAVSKLDNFSVQVAAKQEEVLAAQQIMTALKTEIDRATIETLGFRERITSLDSAMLTSQTGDRLRRDASIGAFALIGAMLLAAGLLLSLQPNTDTHRAT